MDLSCQKKAFEKKRNYIILTDTSQIICGSKNINDLDEEEVDKIAPYISLMALILSQEFPPSKWHSRAVDYILKIGQEIYNQHKESYNKIDSFDIIFSKDHYKVTRIENVFDTYFGKDVFDSYQGHKTIEYWIDTQLLYKNWFGIIYTPDYVVPILLYNYLYYMYDPYSCTNEGDNDSGITGTACIMRFTKLEDLVFKWVNNRLKKVGEDDIEYVRFALIRPYIDRQKDGEEGEEERSVEEDLIITQSKELAKESNFVKLPDNTEIVRGTTNIANFGEGEIEYMAPFACIMAAAVGRKLHVFTWSSEIIDYVLACGVKLFQESQVRFDQVPTLEIPKVTLGHTDYCITVSYHYDALMKQKVVENALNRLLYQGGDWIILVTQMYACALFFNNYLYYMFEPYGCNEIGMGEGPDNTGVACLTRFKDIHGLASRIIFNKNKRELQDQLDYTRFDGFILFDHLILFDHYVV